MEAKSEMKSHIIKICVLVIAIITIGVSLSYAYFTAKFSGEADIDETSLAKFNITSTLQTAAAISNLKMTLIDQSEIKEKADSVQFSVTNSPDSTVNGQYFVHLTGIKITKNLYSEDFKWQLVRVTDSGESEIANGNFANVVRTSEVQDPEDDNVETTVADIDLNKVALEIESGNTDTLLFRIWLENDPENNQVELTNGSFQGKLRITATPKK